MAYRIIFRPVARKAFDRLPSQVQERIGVRLEALAEDPRPVGVVALQGGSGRLRVRVGDYRIIYRIRDESDSILIERVAHRREVYRR